MIDAIIVFFLIASAFATNKILLGIIPPFLFVALRMGISGSILLFFYCFHNNRVQNITFMGNIKKHLWPLILSCLLTVLIPPLLKAVSLRYISASRASFWGTFDPFITAIILYIFYRKAMTLWQTIGCCLGIGAGCYFVIASSSHESFHALFASSFSFADLLQIFAVMIGRGGWIIAQSFFKREIFSPIAFNGISHTMASLLSLILHLITNESTKISWTTTLLGALCYTAIIGNIIAYTAYAYLLKKHSVTFVSLATLCTPLFVHLISPILFKESIHYSFFTSIGIMFIALKIFLLSNEKK